MFKRIGLRRSGHVHLGRFKDEFMKSFHSTNTAFRPMALVALAVPVFFSASAYAQAADVAQKLLDEAKRYNDAGDVAAACSLLDRAYQLDAKDGILYARADCRDREGKISAAVGLYDAYLRTFARMTGAQRQSHAPRASIAEARIKELGPLVPMVQFVWAEKPPADTKIVVDGVEFPAMTLDGKLPLEPGTHEIIVKLPGEPERKRTVILSRGGSTVVDLSPLSESAIEALKGPQKTINVKSGVGKPKPKASNPVDSSKIGGFVGLGLGVAGLVAGSVTGWTALKEKVIVDDHCNGERRCDKEGLAAVDRFQTVGNISTATFIAGGVLASVGATLLVVAYRGSGGAKTAVNVRTTVGPTAVQIGVEGAF